MVCTVIIAGLTPPLSARQDDPKTAKTPSGLPQLSLDPVQFNGKFSSTPQPDGGDIFVYSGGITAVQKFPEEDSLLEFSAQSAVVFYSQKELLERFKDRGESKEKTDLSRYPIGIYLEGDVVLRLDRINLKNGTTATDNVINAEQVYYDFVNKNALILKGKLRLNATENQIPITLRARRIRQWNLSTYLADDIQLSNDEFAEPHVWLGVKRARIVSEKPQTMLDGSQKPGVIRFNLENITMNMGNTPIFWWPKAAGTSSNATSPMQALHTGVNSELGVTLETEWDLAWLLGIRPSTDPQTNRFSPESVTSKLRLDGYSKRGPGIGVDADYQSPVNFGNFKSYLLHDDGEDRLGRFDSRKDLVPPDDLRGRVRWQHRQYLPDDWQGSFEVGYLSDRNFLESWEEREFDREKKPETAIYFKQQRDNWAFDFLNKFHLNDFDYTRTELPRAGFHIAGQDFFELFTYQHDGYITRIGERAGDVMVPGYSGVPEHSILPDQLDQRSFAFANSRHEISLPLHFGVVNIAPTGIVTYVYDDSDKTNSFVQGAMGFRAGSKLWHVNNAAQSRLFDIDRIRHIIEPEVSAFWTESELDESAQQDRYNFTLRQRWQTMRGPQGDKHSVDFLRLDTGVTLVTNDIDNIDLPGMYYSSSPEMLFDHAAMLNDDLANLGLARREQINRSLSDHATGDLSWEISDTTLFNGGINYNLHDRQISQANAAFAVMRSPRTRYYVGYRYLRNADAFKQTDGNHLTNGISYRMNQKYTVAFSQQYDIEQTAASYTRTTLIRKSPHWYSAFSVGYDATRNSMSFTVSFWPEGFGQMALGSQRFSRLEP
ncbi:MAG: hypothetical protein K9M57_03850 [Phycisphaerae bacterium]|nr:hypothetical protein [Phycisphaerae bacterium]